MSKARDELNFKDFEKFLKGYHIHPLFYWVWPRMKLLLHDKITELGCRLKAALIDQKNMDAENHLTFLMKAVNFSKKEWELLINCAMAGKPSVKKFTDDELNP